MDESNPSLSTECQDGKTRYYVKDAMLYVEHLPRRALSASLSSVPLAKLTGEYAEEKTGTYYSWWAMLLIFGPLALLPLLHDKLLNQWAGFGYLLWAAAVFFVARRRDVRFTLYVVGQIKIHGVEVVGRNCCRNRIRQFVEAVACGARGDQNKMG